MRFTYWRDTILEGFRTNPYGLAARYYALMWLFLIGSAVGIIVTARWEPYDDLLEGKKRKRVIYANLLKGLFGALPLLTTGTVFLFPPLYMPY